LHLREVLINISDEIIELDFHGINLGSGLGEVFEVLLDGSFIGGFSLEEIIHLFSFSLLHELTLIEVRDRSGINLINVDSECKGR
jgi:hypothetical protein